jgi:hypothetical protein
LVSAFFHESEALLLGGVEDLHDPGVATLHDGVRLLETFLVKGADLLGGS